jgi:raffinose/stachyose/melibiose transport system permease protein
MATPSSRRITPSGVGKHAVLLTYTAIALFPIVLVVMNSFKERRAIFKQPLELPNAETFSLVGYETLGKRGDFPSYLLNSMLVTGGTLLLVILFGSMAAFALARYRFRFSRLLGLYLALGIMIPIRIGTVSILRLMVDLGLTNTQLGLILVYTAAGLPLAVFILTAFFMGVPQELVDAARVDGAGHGRIYTMVLRLSGAALATVAILTMIPIWNDLWWPLLISPGVPTLTLGTQQFLGQFIADWNAILAALTIAIIPMLVLYLVFNRQFVRGLMGGAVK